MVKSMDIELFCNKLERQEHAIDVTTSFYKP